MAGKIRPMRIRSLKGADIPRDLRRARIIAARGYQAGSIPRNAIMAGYWDHGHIVGQHRENDHGNQG